MKKFLLDVDVHILHRVQFAVEAENIEDAIDRFNVGEGYPVDLADLTETDVEGADDYDVRTVTDTETGEEEVF